MKRLKNKPLFKDIASDIVKFIGDADLAGYNSNKFDIPVIVEELIRTKIDFLICPTDILLMYKIFSIKWNNEL